MDKGFWDSHTPYKRERAHKVTLTAEYKRALVDQKRVFYIADARLAPVPALNGDIRWYVNVYLEEDDIGTTEPYLMIFTQSQQRNHFLKQVEAHLKNGGTAIPTYLAREPVTAGNGSWTYVFRDPSTLNQGTME